MALNDNTRDNGTGGNGPATGSPNGNSSTPPGAVITPGFRDAVNALYRKYYGRDATDAELQAHVGNPGGINAIEDALKASLPAQTTDPTPNPNPNPNPTPTPTGPAAAYLGGSAPQFQPPGYSKPPAFAYADFVAPDPSLVNSDPETQQELKTQQDAIQRSAAARGILNTGGTINDLLTNASDIVRTGYGNIFNRNLSTYAANRQNALDAYNTNYQTQYSDPWKANYMGASDAFNSRAHNFDLGQQYSWYGTLFDEQKLNDAFDRKYKLLGLV